MATSRPENEFLLRFILSFNNFYCFDSDDEKSQSDASSSYVWLRPNLRVRVVDECYRRGKYYKTKVNCFSQSSAFKNCWHHYNSCYADFCWAQYTTTLHPFSGLFSRTTWVTRYQKDVTSLYLNEARDVGVWGWQWQQLDHMQTICTSLRTDNHANIPSLNFYRPDALPDAKPIVSKHWSPT